MSGSLKTVLSTATMLFKYGVPSHILYFGEALGDNLLLSGLARELNKRGYDNIWIKCDHQFLFDLNPHVKFLMPFNTLLSTHLLKRFGIQIISPVYTRYDPQTDRDMIPEKHIFLKMADSLRVKGEVSNKPELYLSAAETTAGAHAAQTIVIVTSGSAALFPMRNKEWIPERYQQVVDRFRNDFEFIQLGSKQDQLLTGVRDLRGQTTVRQSAAILQHAALMISHVGFMMHLARAVDCRSVIIYGGREKPDQSGYACFANICANVPCSPCWLHNRCDFDKRCMFAITAEDVALAVEKQLQLRGTPLTIDALFND